MDNIETLIYYPFPENNNMQVPILHSYYKNINCGQISKNQIQTNNYESLYQFQDNTNYCEGILKGDQNMDLKSSIEKQLNYNKSEINIPNEINEDDNLNELGVNEENSYSFNQMKNKENSKSNIF